MLDASSGDEGHADGWAVAVNGKVICVHGSDVGRDYAEVGGGIGESIGTFVRVRFAPSRSERSD